MLTPIEDHKTSRIIYLPLTFANQRKNAFLHRVLKEELSHRFRHRRAKRPLKV